MGNFYAGKPFCAVIQLNIKFLISEYPYVVYALSQKILVGNNTLVFARRRVADKINHIIIRSRYILCRVISTFLCSALGVAHL